ncbi:MAG: aminoacyl-tRNA hydrolase [Longimicrobiales bacterium]|nr:aminoacyl-tRNA hydrolase [Longimicrobiales bacterium]
MKVIAGLGNPGPEYDGTRHNVGWWVLDRLSHDWRMGSFRREGRALVNEGTVGGQRVTLVKPTTWMNRSGAALAPLRGAADFDPATDLLVVVDDASLDAARVRFRPSGSAGGHNGLRSVEAVLGTREYPRLRIGVGRCPPGEDLADWVLSPMPAEEEDRVVALLPELTRAVEVWLDEGTEAAMSRFNR